MSEVFTWRLRERSFAVACTCARHTPDEPCEHARESGDALTATGKWVSYREFPYVLVEYLRHRRGESENICRHPGRTHE